MSASEYMVNSFSNLFIIISKLYYIIFVYIPNRYIYRYRYYGDIGTMEI